MAQVILMPVGEQSDSLTEFKNQLMKKHQNDLLIALNAYLKNLTLHGFSINQCIKRDAIKKLEEEIYELRIKTIRLLLYFDGDDTFVVLHGFIKKTQQTPKNEIEQARREIQRWKTIKENL